ncbi:putative gp14 [Mycobacteroides abscessus]|nr:putative gp14 [Mycobacteroides abscessus]
MTAEKTQAVAASASIQTDFDKLVTAIKADVPNDKVFAFAKTLQGTTEDELASHAAELKSIFGSSLGSSPAYDPSQGRGAATSASPSAAFEALLKSKLTR